MIGQTIGGRYKVVSLFGEDALGTTYLAETEGAERALLLVLAPEADQGGDALQNLLARSERLQALGNGHIVPVIASGVVGDRQYVATPYGDGESLRDLVKRQRGLEPDQILNIAWQIARACGAAASVAVHHYGLSSDVVLVAEGDEAEPLPTRVLRLGFSDLLPGYSPRRKGAFYGVPEYLAPETCGGKGRDERSDVYAVGILMYEMAVGKPPFQSNNAATTLKRQVYEKPLPLHLVKARLANVREFEKVVLKAIHKDPEHRYGSFREMAEGLEAYRTTYYPDLRFTALAGQEVVPLPSATRDAGGEAAGSRQAGRGPAPKHQTLVFAGLAARELAEAVAETDRAAAASAIAAEASEAVEAAPAEAAPADTALLEAAPAEAAPAEAAPADTESMEAPLADTALLEAAPADAASVEALAAESAPAATALVEAAPAEAAPAEAAPAEAAKAEAAKAAPVEEAPAAVRFEDRARGKGKGKGKGKTKGRTAAPAATAPAAGRAARGAEPTEKMDDWYVETPAELEAREPDYDFVTKKSGQGFWIVISAIALIGIAAAVYLFSTMGDGEKTTPKTVPAASSPGASTSPPGTGSPETQPPTQTEKVEAAAAVDAAAAAEAAPDAGTAAQTPPALAAAYEAALRESAAEEEKGDLAAALRLATQAAGSSPPGDARASERVAALQARIAEEEKAAADQKTAEQAAADRNAAEKAAADQKAAEQAAALEAARKASDAKKAAEAKKAADSKKATDPAKAAEAKKDAEAKKAEAAAAKKDAAAKKAAAAAAKKDAEAKKTTTPAPGATSDGGKKTTDAKPPAGDPKDEARRYTQLGVSAYKAGQYDLAVRYLEKAEKLDPENKLVKMYLQRARTQTP